MEDFFVSNEDAQALVGLMHCFPTWFARWVRCERLQCMVRDSLTTKLLVVLADVVYLLFLQLVMRWFQYSIADFEESFNPENGSFVVMERREKDDTVRM